MNFPPFLPGLWVPQTEVPNQEILVIFVAFHLIILSSIYILYKISINSVIKSLISPSKEAKKDFPSKLILSIRLMFFGLAFIVINNTLAHLFSLFFNIKEYFSIGGESLLLVFGFGTFFFGLADFLYLLNRLEDENTKLTLRERLNIIGMLFGIYLFIHTYNSFRYLEGISIFDYLFLIIFWISLALINLSFFIYKSLDLRNSSLMNIRALLAEFILIFNFSSFIILSIIYLPRGHNPNLWPTRTSKVEFYIFAQDIISLISAALIYLVIKMPRWFRLKFKILDVDYNRNLDDRFDFQINLLNSENLISDNEYNYQKNFEYGVWGNNNKDLAIFYEGSDLFSKYNETNLEEIFYEYKPVKILPNDYFNGEYIKKYFLPKKTVLFIFENLDITIKSILYDLQSTSGYKIDFNPININGFAYSSSQFKFGSLGIIHPFKDMNMKLILLQMNELNLQSLNIFINSYFRSILNHSTYDNKFLIFKFPSDKKIEEVISNQPKFSELLNQGYVDIYSLDKDFF